MRRWPMLLALCPACAVHEMLPTGPVLREAEREAVFAEERPSGTAYTGAPASPVPTLPLLVFGATYDLDLVLVSRHPDWQMHEYARLRTPSGPVWLAKDARRGSRDQSLVAGVEDLASWMPEIPLPRKRAPVEVDDRSTPDRLDLVLRYENIDGVPVEVHYEGPPPTKEMRRRNGSTMGHSRDQVLAVLDVSHRTFGKRARMVIGGEEVPLDRILGLVPFRMVLRQTQGGLAEASYRQEPGEEGFRTHHLVMDAPVVLEWTVVQEEGARIARQEQDVRALSYRFLEVDGAWELSRAEVLQWGQEGPGFRIAFAPALPDLRRPFEGTRTSRYVMDVGEERNHAVGTFTARWEGDTVRVDVHPEAPWWTTDRCVTSRIRYTGGGTEVETSVDPC